MIERYTRPEMARLWGLATKFTTWLEVEMAVCEAWTTAGRIPGHEMELLREKAAPLLVGFTDEQVARIADIEATTRHDVIAFLTLLEEELGESARFIHIGCTSSDIGDTANALLLSRAGARILAGIDAVLVTLKETAQKYKGVLMMGRTHGVHAEPISFGLKMAGYFAEFARSRDRVAAAVKGLGVGKISGAVGTYTLLPPSVEQEALTRLGLGVDPHSTQIIQRDRYAAFFCSLAVLGGGIERLCVELRHMQRTEVLEVEEGFAKGQKGSSAMPHKKNPISAENLAGLSRLLRGNALASLENQALWHERDISHSSVERVIMADSTILADYMLARLRNLVANLVIHEDNMQRNMKASFGLFFSQRVLAELLKKGLPRQQAYEIVQAAAMTSWEQKRDFESLVRIDETISKVLDAQELDTIFDPTYALAHEDTILSRSLCTDIKHPTAN